MAGFSVFIHVYHLFIKQILIYRLVNTYVYGLYYIR